VEIHNKSCEEGVAANMRTKMCHSFFKKSATSIVNCIKNNFHNNLEAFLAKYGNKGKFTHCNLHKKCPGTGCNYGTSNVASKPTLITHVLECLQFFGEKYILSFFHRLGKNNFWK